MLNLNIWSAISRHLGSADTGMSPQVSPWRHKDFSIHQSCRHLCHHLQCGEKDEESGDIWISESITVCRHLCRHDKWRQWSGDTLPYQIFQRLSVHVHGHYIYPSSSKLEKDTILREHEISTNLTLVSHPLLTFQPPPLSNLELSLPSKTST